MYIRIVNQILIIFFLHSFTQATKEIDATFPVSLALEFPVKNVLLGMLKLTEYLTLLPEEKPTSKIF
jgi:hypothetical protein